MRILILCGSLAPGKDGVGDYSRRLASELKNRGIDVFLIASHDKQLTTKEASEEVLRIPYGTSMGERMDILNAAIKAFSPDWLSLQYVPYSFNNYGLPLSFVRAVKNLKAYGKWHIMFHELWIDHQGLSTPKRSSISLLQRLSVRILTNSLKPFVLHTHLPGYQLKLKKIGVETSPLPLFANIHAHSLLKPEPISEGKFQLGFFSQMELRPEVIAFIKKLNQWLIAEKNMTLEISLLGGSSAKVNATAQELAHRIPGVTVRPVGFLASDELSLQLQKLDLGITPVRYHAVGKSGTVAAFLTHGVPVAAPWRTEKSPSFFIPDLELAIMHSFNPGALAEVITAAKTLDTYPISISGVVDQMLTDLNLHIGAKVLY